jgi:parallel beta-helix repeat protein
MVLLIWWFVSRAIKIYPSIRRDPKNWMLLPAYIFFSYFFAVIRIYTFFTMNQQGWITRWDASRMGGASQIWRAYAKLYTSYAATASVMLAMILWVGTVQANKLQTPDVVFAMESELPAYNYDDALVQINDLKMPVQLAGNAEVSDRVINYEMSYGESLDFVARRFGLEQDNIIAGQGGFARQERILLKPPFMEHAKWERGLRRAAAAETTSIIYDVQQETIIIAGAGQAVTIPDLYRTLNDEELMSDEGNGVYLLKKKLLVTDNAALIIESPGVNWLKIQSNARNESLAVVSVVGEQAGISIDGVKISSWDSERNDYDVKSSDGRAFVLIKNGRMDVMNSEISYLGHPILDADGRGGVYGLSWRVYDDTFIGRQTVTGQIANNRIHHNYFGLYTFAATSMTIRNNEIYENEQYGIDPHTGSNNLLIEQNYIHNNGNHGIVLSRDCFNNVIRYNRSEANRLHGVLLDRNSNHNEIYDNVFRDNFDGIGLWNSHNNLIYNNALSENRRGIRLDQDSHNNGIYNNRLTKNSEYGVYFYGGAFGNWLWENTIHHSEIGVYLRSSANTVLDNTLVENRYGIYLTESAKRNRVAQNQLHDYEVGLYLKTEPDDFLAENRFNGSMVENAHNLQITGAWHALGTLQ